MHPELLKRTVKACRDYIDAGDCHGEAPSTERLIEAVVQLADALPEFNIVKMLVKRDEWEALSPEAQERLNGLAAQQRAEAARQRAAFDHYEGRSRIGNVQLDGTAGVNACDKDKPKGGA